MPKDKDEDLIYNQQTQEVDNTEAFTPVELASNKAVHDGKVKEELDSENAVDEEPLEEDFDRFNVDAVDKLKETKED